MSSGVGRIGQGNEFKQLVYTKTECDQRRGSPCPRHHGTLMGEPRPFERQFIGRLHFAFATAALPSPDPL